MSRAVASPGFAAACASTRTRNVRATMRKPNAWIGIVASLLALGSYVISSIPVSLYLVTHHPTTERLSGAVVRGLREQPAADNHLRSQGDRCPWLMHP